MRTSAPAVSELDRVRRDLSTLRNAAGIGLPFGKEVVRFWLVIATSSAVVALAFAVGSAAQRLAALGLFVAVGAALLLGVILHLVRITRQRHEDPATWREYKQITTMKMVLLPLVMAFFAWQAWIDVPVRYLASTAVFFIGLVSLLYGVSTWGRRPAIGIGLPILFYSAVVSVASGEQMLLLGAVCVTVAGLLFASILAWQLRDADGAESRSG